MSLVLLYNGCDRLTDFFVRVIGSKIQVAGWSAYTALIWCLKLSMLSFYIRLTVRSLLSSRPRNNG